MQSLTADLRLALDPAAFSACLGITPDPWQAGVLQWRGRRLVLNCARQTGKSTTAATLALHRALYYPGSLILLVSPSQRQSTELFRKIANLLDQLPERPATPLPDHAERRGSPSPRHEERSGSPSPRHPERSGSSLPRHPERPPQRVVAESKDAAVYLPRPTLLEDNRLSCVFANRSRIVSLPSSEATIRGFSGASLIIEDEASRVPDDLYRAIRPMLATSNGRIILMSTPFGKRGHFWETWSDEAAGWERVRVPASACPRISPAFLAEERESLGAWWYAQEYDCEFVDAAASAFTGDMVRAAQKEPVEAWNL